MARQSLAALVTALVTALLLVHAPNSGSAAATKRARREVATLEGPTDQEIYDSGLTERAVSYLTIVEKSRQYFSDTKARNFHGPALGYVTPWNRQGYALAATFRHKLSHLSPVWYQLRRPHAGGAFVLAGGHEVNQTWISELRAAEDMADRVPRIVPRVVFELEGRDLLEAVASPVAVVQLLVSEAEAQGYDGLVLEVWSQWAGGLDHSAGFRAQAFAFLRLLSEKLRDGGRELVLAVPPLVPAHPQAPATRAEHIAALRDAVDGWSVMTYDYSHPGAPGPNAPLEWVQQNMDSALSGGGSGSKGGDASAAAAAAAEDAAAAMKPYASTLWFGLNFYGNDYAPSKRGGGGGGGGGGSAILGQQYLELLRRHAPRLTWDEAAAEHVFEYKSTADGSSSGGQHVVYYPTPRSLADRLDAAQARGVGVSIWELGQGLERFMDLL